MSNAELMRDYDSWKGSLRNFEWLTNTVPGATDIDVFIERKGNFLVLETKAWMANYGIKIPFGQYLALMALTKIPEFTVVLIGETDDEDTLYYLDVREVEGVKNRTGPVWYKHTEFAVTTRAGLTAMVKDWYDGASK